MFFSYAVVPCVTAGAVGWRALRAPRRARWVVEVPRCWSAHACGTVARGGRSAGARASAGRIRSWGLAPASSQPDPIASAWRGNQWGRSRGGFRSRSTGRPPLTTQELHSRAKRSTCVIPLRLLGLRQREGAQQEPKAWDSPVPPATHLGLLWRDPDRGDKEATHLGYHAPVKYEGQKGSETRPALIRKAEAEE
jgi:hypothetical protein